MNNFSGENLDWFWRGWFLNDWKLDQAVTSVGYGKSRRFGNGPVITIKNLKKMPMPVLITVETSAGKTKHYKLPVEIWMRGPVFKFRPKIKGKITRVILDAKHQLPDINRKNNSWPRKA